MNKVKNAQKLYEKVHYKQMCGPVSNYGLTNFQNCLRKATIFVEIQYAFINFCFQNKADLK